jgi:hypothetical protein
VVFFCTLFAILVSNSFKDSIQSDPKLNLTFQRKEEGVLGRNSQEGFVEYLMRKRLHNFFYSEGKIKGGSDFYKIILESEVLISYTARIV